MHALSTALVATTLASSALGFFIPPRIGIPANVDVHRHNGREAPLEGQGTFSIKQVRNHKYRGGRNKWSKKKNGPVALARAYRKFHIKVPEDLAVAVETIQAEDEPDEPSDETDGDADSDNTDPDAAPDGGDGSSGDGSSDTKRATGSEVTTPVQSDAEYLTPVSIGTPPQVLNLDFDTGSSDLWVFSAALPASSINGQDIYDPKKSRTAKQIPGATWSITYGDQSSSSGDVYSDTVTVGGLTVANQAVEAAKTVSDQFEQDSDNDGLLGLAFSKINTVKPTQQKTFFDNAKANLDAPVFTADLKFGAPGTYNFGFIDQKAYTGNISYVPVDSSRGFWTFNTKSYAIGTTTTKATISGIADTGTTLLLLPDSIVAAYYRKVSGATNNQQAGGYTFPCSASLPTFGFTVGTTLVTIPGNYMNFSPLAEGSTTCYGGIQSNAGIGFSIFGDVALKAAFVVFDGGKNQLGWANKRL